MTRSAAAAERALYLTLVLAVLLVFGVLAGIELLERVTTRLFGFRPENDFGFGSDPGASLATVIVTGSAWLYHVAIRQRDLRAGPLTGAAAWMPRVYLYGATLAGPDLHRVQHRHAAEPGVRPLTGRVPDRRLRHFARAPGRRRHRRDRRLGHRLARPLVVRDAITRGTGWRRIRSDAARLRVAYLRGRHRRPWPSPPPSLPSWR